MLYFCDDNVKRLLDFAVDQRMKQQWVKITDDPNSLPPFGLKVDVCGSKRLDRAMAYTNEHGEWLVETCSDVINIYPPKFWRRLPELPLAPPEDD
jgi:hypothetical protein